MNYIPNIKTIFGIYRVERVNFKVKTDKKKLKNSFHLKTIHPSNCLIYILKIDF